MTSPKSQPSQVDTTSQMTVSFKADFGKTSSDYAKHRAGFPPSFFARLSEFRIGVAGQRILDLGTGTGTLARGLADQGSHVVGLDVSAQQIEAAKELDREAELSIDYVLGRAEATGLPPASFDIVIAGQCWHWFDSMATMAEVTRLLKPGGRLVICHFDWIPVPGSVVEATERLIEAHNPIWKIGGGTGIYPKWAVDAGRAGFHDLEIFAYDHAQPYTHESWRGRIRASAGVGGTLSPEAVKQFDNEHEALLKTRFPGEPLLTPHRIFALIAMRP